MQLRCLSPPVSIPFFEIGPNSLAFFVLGDGVQLTPAQWPLPRNDMFSLSGVAAIPEPVQGAPGPASALPSRMWGMVGSRFRSLTLASSRCLPATYRRHPRVPDVVYLRRGHINLVQNGPDFLAPSPNGAASLKSRKKPPSYRESVD